MQSLHNKLVLCFWRLHSAAMAKSLLQLTISPRRRVGQSFKIVGNDRALCASAQKRELAGAYGHEAVTRCILQVLGEQKTDQVSLVEDGMTAK